MTPDMRSVLNEQWSWARGSPQPRCYTYLLCSAGIVCTVLGVLCMLVSTLEVLGVIQPVFSDRFLLWWSISGMVFGPAGTMGLSLMGVGMLCWLSARIRMVLNTLTLLTFVGAAFFIAMFEASRLVYVGSANEDMMRMWSTAETTTICDIQHTLRCSGLATPCYVEPYVPEVHPRTQPPVSLPSSLPPARYANGMNGSNVTDPSLPSLFVLSRKYVEPVNCRNCSEYYAQRGWMRYKNVTCASEIQRDAEMIIMPASLTAALVTLFLAVVCMMCTQPMGLAFASTAFLLVSMTMSFASWRRLRDPTLDDIHSAQRIVAATANFLSLCLALISIAGLHWKDAIANDLKRNITVILLLVPVFAVASSVALLFPFLEDFFATVREIYSTLLLLTLVSIWDTTAETKALISISSEYDRNMQSAESIRDTHRGRVRFLTLFKVVVVDINLYLFGGLYPQWVHILLVIAGALIFSFVLVVIHEIYTHLPALESVGTHQFFSVKAIVSFIFFEFAILKVLNFEGLHSVVMGELYISVALVCSLFLFIGILPREGFTFQAKLIFLGLQPFINVVNFAIINCRSFFEPQTTRYS